MYNNEIADPQMESLTNGEDIPMDQESIQSDSEEGDP